MNRYNTIIDNIDYLVYDFIHNITETFEISHEELEQIWLNTLNKPSNNSNKTKTKAKPIDENLNPEFYEYLRSERNKLATTNNISPFIIFNNTTLRDISNKLPSTKDDLLNIYGIGSSKIDKYGEFILNTVNNYKNNIP